MISPRSRPETTTLVPPIPQSSGGFSNSRASRAADSSVSESKATTASGGSVRYLSDRNSPRSCASGIPSASARLPFSSRMRAACDRRCAIPELPGTLSSSRTVPPSGTPLIAARPSASPSAALSAEIQATAPLADISDSIVTTVVSAAARRTSPESASVSAGTNMIPSAPPSTSRASRLLCSPAWLGRSSARKRSSAPRSTAACSIPCRAGQLALSAPRRMTERDKSSCFRCRPGGSNATIESSTPIPNRESTPI